MLQLTIISVTFNAGALVGQEEASAEVDTVAEEAAAHGSQLSPEKPASQEVKYYAPSIFDVKRRLLGVCSYNVS